jgi:hypothetical protein
MAAPNFDKMEANVMEAVKIKRPTIITIIAILILLSIPVDIVKFVSLNRTKYQENIKNDEILIKDGKIQYQNKIIYWDKQGNAKKSIIKNRLIRNKKITSIYIVFKFFKGVFIVLDILLFYGLWNLKKWTYVILIMGMSLGILFNVILMFFNIIAIAFLLVLGIALITLGVKNYGRYFVY